MRSIKPITSIALIFILTTQLFSCGYLLHPERQGKKSGKIDVAIVALDSIGLLFFILPGLIALGVDIYSGTIYMPLEQNSLAPNWKESVKIKVDPNNITKESIAAAIKDQTGIVINLDDPKLKIFSDEKLAMELKKS